MRKLGLIILWMLSANVFARDVTVFDVYSGKEWNLVNFYKNVKSRQPGGNKEVSVSYPGFADSSQLGLKQLNIALYKLALADWQSDDAYRALMKEAEARCDVRNRNSKSGSPGRYGSIDRFYTLVEDVELKALTVYREECWLELVYSLSVAGDDRLELKRFFKANLRTGALEPVSFYGNIPDVDRLRSFLAPLFTEQYVLVTDKLSAAEKTPQHYIDPEQEVEYNSEYENDVVVIDQKNKETVCRDLCKYIDFNEMHVYRLGWGVVVGFQENTKSSLVYNTESFAMFLTGTKQDSLALLLNRPDLAADHRVITHEFKNFNYYKLSEGISSVRFAPAIEKLVKLQQSPVKKVRAVRIDSYQVFESGMENFRGFFLRTFDKNGWPESYAYVDEQKDTVMSEYYQYDRLGNLINSRGISDRKKFKTKYWRFDQSNNLTEYQQLDGEDVYAGYFFYNGHVFYKIEVDGASVRDNRVEKVSFQNREVCFKTACYVLNDEYVPRFQTQRKYLHEELQTGFDAKGRLMETHSENDRYNYYFNYDARDRFVSQEIFEYQRLQTSVKYLYKEDAVLPYEQHKHSYGNGQNIFEKEVYNWEYW